MNVLVLGATSVIGSEIAAAFASGNHLLLVGRDAARLADAERRCTSAGAVRIDRLPYSLSAGCDELAGALAAYRVDIMVNAASATSRLRDGDVDTTQLASYMNVDVVAPLDLAGRLAARHPLAVVFVSSVLAVARSPNRTIYGNLKAIHERALLTLAEREPRIRPHIFRIATIIDPDRRGRRAREAGQAVRRAFDAGKRIGTYGLAGRLMTALYLAQPAAYAAIIKLSRVVRGAAGAARRRS